MSDTIAVLTGKSSRQILGAGGCGEWVLNPKVANQKRYLVCVRNGSSKEPDASEAHGSAFLIGIISGFEPMPPLRNIARWKIAISSYAAVSIPELWRNWRNPVRYTSMAELGIDPDGLTFGPMPTEAELPAPTQRLPARKLTIADAKEGLAAMFGVTPDQIEIVIRA